MLRQDEMGANELSWQMNNNARHVEASIAMHIPIIQLKQPRHPIQALHVCPQVAPCLDSNLAQQHTFLRASLAETAAIGLKFLSKVRHKLHDSVRKFCNQSLSSRQLAGKGGAATVVIEQRCRINFHQGRKEMSEGLT